MYLDEQQLKMLVVFSPIFVADTKIILRYNFVAPLNLRVYGHFIIKSARINIFKPNKTYHARRI